MTVTTELACWKCDHLRAAVRERDEAIRRYPGLVLTLDVTDPAHVEAAIRDVHDLNHHDLGVSKP